MRYVYSVIRFVPDPIKGEFVNVGLIAGSEDSSEWGLRTVENQKRARQLDQRGVLPAVFRFISDVGSRLDNYTEAVEMDAQSPEAISEKWLGDMFAISRNVVQLSPPTPVVADSLEGVFELLTPQFLLDPERRIGSPNKHPALAAVRRAYRDTGLLGGAHLAERAEVIGLHHRDVFDFVVANGRAVQLTHTFSFQVPSPFLSERLKAWAWTVRDIRQSGAEAKIGNERIVEVPATVDIEGVYVPPAAGASHALVDEALSAFRAINVQPVEFSHAEDVGRKASEALGA